MKQVSRYVICRTTGLCAALSMLISISVISVAVRILPARYSLVADTDVKVSNPSDSVRPEITVSEPADIAFEDSDVLHKAYDAGRKLIRSRGDRQEQKKDDDMIPDEDDETGVSDSTTSTTASATVSSEQEQTTVTTTMPSQATSSAVTATTTGASENGADSERVSNGKEPFNYNDVSSIASDMKTLGDFVEKVSPSSLSWDTEEYAENGCVRITLQAENGMAVLDVKPVTAGEELYRIDGEESGSINGSQIGEWPWLAQNRKAGCNISSVTWISAGFGIKPVRGIDIGSSLAKVTDNYLCVNGGATTLYKASDVIKDQSKLNAILSDENQYTFVGGRFYSIGSYLDKYYNGKEQNFRFEDCDYVVQYGCNSIMDHNYTTGSWIIEYAVKEDVVTGICFMNKSYYRNEQKPVISTNNISGSESGMNTTYTEASVFSDENTEDPSDVETEGKDTEADVTSDEEAHP